jgi:hypothetical protein
MLEGVMLEKSSTYLRDMIAKLSSLNHYIRQQPGFVKNKFTECAEQCVAGFYTYYVDETGIPFSRGGKDALCGIDELPALEHTEVRGFKGSYLSLHW